mmetsp:Transcript_22225/g.40920  ORF Transcript_22225/g.40920 Transcript_22225/m.40920 type:complete len:101 (+) Transcript_22225:257-559(+)
MLRASQFASRLAQRLRILAVFHHPVPQTLWKESIHPFRCASPPGNAPEKQHDTPDWKLLARLQDQEDPRNRSNKGRDAAIRILRVIVESNSNNHQGKNAL